MDITNHAEPEPAAFGGGCCLAPPDAEKQRMPAAFDTSWLRLQFLILQEGNHGQEKIEQESENQG